MGREQLASIRAKAEALAGENLGEDGDLLVSMAADRALAWCRRSDIPPGMEQAVAALAVSMTVGGAVKTLTRGDTSISYETGGSGGVMAMLSPWRRLGGLKREGSME